VSALAAACTRCTTHIEHGDLRCAVCALVVVEAPPRSEEVRATLLRCVECGAAVAYSAEREAPHCAFCGAVMQVEEPVDPPERAELMLPFAVDREAAAAALRHWLGTRGWLAPRDLAAQARLEHLHPVHWAAWIVDARALVSWTADSDAGAGRAAWAPHAGQTVMDFDRICVPASRALRPAECAELTPRHDLRAAIPMAPAALDADDAVEQFEVQRSGARRHVLGAIEGTAVARLQRGVIPGRRFRHVRTSLLLQGLATRRVALPAWVLAYRYRDRPYRAVVHGQDAGLVVGRAPRDTTKILLLVALAIAVVIAVALLLTRG
jgi:hypothetical protein